MTDTPASVLRDTLCFLKDPLSEENLFLVSDPCKHHFSTPLQTVALQKKAVEIPKPLPPVSIHKEAMAPRIPTPTPKKEHALPTQEIQSALQKLLPSLRLTQTIPDDQTAKKTSNLWKEKIEGIDVVLLALSQDGETLELLKSLAKAIDNRLGKAKIILAERLETTQNWDLFFEANSFRLVILSEGIENYKHLPPFLNNLQSLSLLHPAVYKQIEQKATLWKTLCQKLQ